MTSTPKVNVGDTVNLKPMKVFDVTSGGVWVVDTNDVRHFYSQDNIASVTRPALKVGDRVHVKGYDTAPSEGYPIECVVGKTVAISYNGKLLPMTYMDSDLTRIGGAE